MEAIFDWGFPKAFPDNFEMTSGEKAGVSGMTERQKYEFDSGLVASSAGPLSALSAYVERGWGTSSPGLDKLD